MSALRDLHAQATGEDKADKAERNIQEAGVARSHGFDEAMATYQGVREQYQPYMETGKAAASALTKLFSDPSSITSDPFFKAREARQLGAVETSASAKGKLFGGQTLIELMKTGGEFASAEFDKATARYESGARIGLAGTQGYDTASQNLAELQVGRGMGEAKTKEDMSSINIAKGNVKAGMFASWFGGSGPFGQATGGAMKGGGCYIAAYHFGYASSEHFIIARHVHEAQTWKAKLARTIYTLLKPLFYALLKEARDG